ncbi:MAG: 16S rRNA (guanine(966)-N(2))-methyltransferase RsmD [bacterium]|nr:16S rRNA (guanine(966)-N(2))-methyltransferase RsmD [bacterium]
MTGRSQLRILAGALGGRRIEVAAGVRPTESRVREALFAIWQERVPGSTFLDLFAGSGAVGLEALSRGAARACFVESRPRALAALRRNWEKNRELLAPARVEILRGVLPQALGRLRDQRFDLIFADPPYDFSDYPSLLRAAVGRVRPEGELAVEHSARVEVAVQVAGWQRRAQHRYGDTRLSLYRFAPGEGSQVTTTPKGTY